jgi:RNA polymerase sigma-70 factor (ECF subfamily)
MTDETDIELMRRVRCTDHEAFEVIVDRYKHQLVNYLTQLVGNRERAEDYAQEAFVRLYENAERYEERGLLAPYLFRIATNLVRSDLRRSMRWRALFPLLSTSVNGNGSSPHGALLEEEIQRKVSTAIERLPIPFRAPLVLREMEEWSYQEIAAALGCSEGTVKSRINRARQKLRDELAPYWTEGAAS